MTPTPILPLGGGGRAASFDRALELRLARERVVGEVFGDGQVRSDRILLSLRLLEEHVGSIERELAMVKVRGTGDNRVEALRLADAFRARVIDATTESFVFELTGRSDKIDGFVELMLPLGLVEVSRTGVVAISRGPEGM